MKIHQRVLLGIWLLLIALLPISAATYKGTITIKVGETTRVNIGSGYMGTEIITSGDWDKSNSTFIIQSVSGMYQKECTIKGNKVGSGKLYWTGYIFGDAWDFYWDVTVVASTPSLSLTTNPSGGVVSKGDFVKFVATPNEDWVEIRYTLDGSDPKSSSTSIIATSTRGFTITKSCTLKAYASAIYSNGTYTDSEVITKQFSVSSTPQKKRTIHLEEPGTLSRYISEDEKYSITDLTLSGVLNGTDLRLLRHMAGMSHLRDANTALIVTNGKLSNLDIKDVSFVKGGDWYLEAYGTYFYTTNSKDLPDYAFAWCPRLEKIYLPRESTKLNYFALHWLENLNEVELPAGLTSIDENFNKCTNLKSISIPNGVTSIDYQSFNTYGETGGLSTIYCYATTAPYTKSGFPNNLKNAILHVPKGSIGEYKNATGWKDFKSIVEDLTPTIRITNITLNSNSESLKVSDTKQLNATISPSNATDNSVTWTSSPTGIVTVSSTGEVKAIKEGTTTVTCKANDGSGVTATCKVTVTKPDVVVAEINATNFPDATFRSWILSQSYGADGKLTEDEISKITSIDVSGSSSSPGTIKSLKGIENFTALKYLYCSSNQLTALDVSKNTALTYLSCYQNKLTALDVSKLTALTYLSCENNQLTALDVSKLTALTYLSCENNQLTALDVSKLTALKTLYCHSNQLTALDVSKLTALTSLSCYNNQLTALDVSKNTALTSLYCYNNQLTALDVSKLTALTMLSCYNNGLKGVAMDNLISSLPKNNSSEVHRFRVVGEDLANEGNVCTTTQVAAVKAKGWLPCYYDSTAKEYVEYKGSDDTPTTKGDVNGDGYVNGTDLVALTNIILGKSSKTDAADVNGDGYVNGTDYVALANIVLGRSSAKATAMAKGAIQAAATTGLSIESLDIKAGESKEMVIDLANPSDEITLVQFDLRLPAGLSVKQTGGEYDYDIAGRTTWRKHSLDANATNGIVRFLLASSSNATLTGTEGAIVTITVQADNSFTGGDIQLENILLVTPAEKEIKQSNYTYHVGQSQPTPASTGLSVEPFNITAGGETEMVIDLTNPDDDITLVQFDLRLPAGLSVKQTGGEYDYDIAGRTTWRKHSLDANATNGIVRFLLASNSNATLTGTEGAVIKITLKADNTFTGGDIQLENILLVTPAEKEIKQSDVSYTIGTTGIKRVVADSIEKDAVIYSPSGLRLYKPRKGLNIIGGKKVMVK